MYSSTRFGRESNTMDKILHDLDQSVRGLIRDLDEILTAIRTLNQMVKRQRRLINSLQERNDRQYKMITNQREVIRYMQDYIKSEF